MFQPEDIQSRLREKPFRPVQLIVSEGLRYEVHHPDLVLVGERDLIIGFPGKRNPMVYDQVVRVALAHVVGLEDIPAQVNGST